MEGIERTSEPDGPTVEQGWRRVARPLLTITAVGVSCVIVFDLVVQWSPYFFWMERRDQRWYSIAGLIALDAIAIGLRLRVRHRDPNRRTPVVSQALLILSCLGMSAFIASGRLRGCQGALMEFVPLVLAPLGLAFVAAIFEHSRAIMVATGSIAVALFFLITPTFLGARHCAVNKAPQSSLLNALVAARTFYTDDDTYQGFTPDVAEEIEPSLDFIPWTGARDGGAKQVQIKVVDDDTIMFLAYSDYGSPWCLVDTPTGADFARVTYGQSDSGDPADCANPKF